MTNPLRSKHEYNQGTSFSKPSSSWSKKERLVLRAAVVEPLIFSTVFCIIDSLMPLFSVPADDLLSVLLDISTYSGLVDNFIGYFAATLISMVAFMLLQQYYFNSFAGLDDDKVLTLCVYFLIYLIFYVLYLYSKETVSKWIVFVLTFIVCRTIWTSLEEDIQWINGKRKKYDKGVFSSKKGRTASKYNSGIFSRPKNSKMRRK